MGALQTIILENLINRRLQKLFKITVIPLYWIFSDICNLIAEISAWNYIAENRESTYISQRARKFLIWICETESLVTPSLVYSTATSLILLINYNELIGGLSHINQKILSFDSRQHYEKGNSRTLGKLSSLFESAINFVVVEGKQGPGTVLRFSDRCMVKTSHQFQILWLRCRFFVLLFMPHEKSDLFCLKVDSSAVSVTSVND